MINSGLLCSLNFPLVVIVQFSGAPHPVRDDSIPKRTSKQSKKSEGRAETDATMTIENHVYTLSKYFVLAWNNVFTRLFLECTKIVYEFRTSPFFTYSIFSKRDPFGAVYKASLAVKISQYLAAADICKEWDCSKFEILHFAPYCIILES